MNDDNDDADMQELMKLRERLAAEERKNGGMMMGDASGVGGRGGDGGRGVDGRGGVRGLDDNGGGLSPGGGSGGVDGGVGRGVFGDDDEALLDGDRWKGKTEADVGDEDGKEEGKCYFFIFWSPLLELRMKKKRLLQ